MKSSFAMLVVASVGADECKIDAMSALQGSARVEVKKHHQEVCRSVEVGQKAPIDGVFTANDGSKVTYRVTRGEVAPSAGRFCVDEPTVALLQRAFSVSDVSDFDVLVQKKQTTTEEETTASTEATLSGKGGTTASTKAAPEPEPVTDAPVTDAPVTDAPAATCPPVSFESVPNFDLDAFVSARWWIQQQMPIEYLPADQNRCVYAEYQKFENATAQGYDIQVRNHAEEVVAPYTVVDSGDTICANIVDAASGKLEVAPCFLPTTAAGPYWVIDFNHDEGYALISGGAPKESADGGCRTGTGVNDSGLWIFTRQQNRDEGLVQKVRKIAQDKGFDLSVLNDVDNSECTEQPTNATVMSEQ